MKTKETLSFGFNRKRNIPVPIIKRLINSPGTPIEPKLRAYLEHCLQRDLAYVRFHNDSLSALSASMLNAQAFTVGHHIIFGANQFDPSTKQGRRLLVHELVHTLQQVKGLQVLYKNTTIADLEREADYLAELVADGYKLPANFKFTPAPFGLIQCHEGPKCPGTQIKANDRSVWMPANEAIEIAYKNAHQGHTNSIFFGSQFENRDVQLPKGTPDGKFLNEFLDELRGIKNQLRPDIIDFKNRVFYEIKTVGNEREGDSQLQSYYDIADAIVRKHGRQGWNRDLAGWYPPHILHMPSVPPQNLIVCTQATDHKKYAGLILYDVRKMNRNQRRETNETEIATRREIESFESDLSALKPMIRKELKKNITKFDPQNPEYVIIAPEEFYHEWYKQRNEKVWEQMRVKAPFVDPKHPVGQFHIFAGGATAAAAASIGLVGLVSSFANLSAAASMVATAAASTTAVLTAVPVTGATSTIVAPAAIVGRIAAEATAKKIAIELTISLLKSKGATTLASLGGVIVVLFSGVSTANAANGATDYIAKTISAIRVVPISDFIQLGSLQFASDTEGPAGIYNVHTPETAKHKFNLSTKVMFNGDPHYIIGKVKVH